MASVEYVPLRVLKCRNCPAEKRVEGRLNGKSVGGWVCGRRNNKGGWWCPACIAADEAVREAAAAERRANPRPRGFAAMRPETRHRIASLGGKASQASGGAHRWTTDEARRAGQKGGTVSRGGRGKAPATAA